MRPDPSKNTGRMRAICSLLIALLPLSITVDASGANAAVENSGVTQVVAHFAALSLYPHENLTGTAVAVRNITAWVTRLAVNVDGKPVHRIRLIQWQCVDPARANCPPNPPPDYYVGDDDYTAGYASSVGVSYGVLAVPFKYHFSDHSLTAGSTLGGYIGITEDVGFEQLSEVIGGGLALIDTASPNAAAGAAEATGSTSTLTGVSVAGGLLGKIGSSNTQFGLLFGIDEVSRAANYRYSGKLWMSFSFGYDFSE